MPWLSSNRLFSHLGLVCIYADCFKSVQYMLFSGWTMSGTIGKPVGSLSKSLDFQLLLNGIALLLPSIAPLNIKSNLAEFVTIAGDLD